METILIPTDFSKSALHVAEIALQRADKPLHIVFTHLFQVPDSIQDLLFSTYRKKEYDFVTLAFSEGIKDLKRLYPHKIEQLSIRFFYGNTLALFKRFLETEKISYVMYSGTSEIKKLSKNSHKALPIIRKCGLKLVDVDTLRIPEPEFV